MLGTLLFGLAASSALVIGGVARGRRRDLLRRWALGGRRSFREDESLVRYIEGAGGGVSGFAILAAVAGFLSFMIDHA